MTTEQSGERGPRRRISRRALLLGAGGLLVGGAAGAAYATGVEPFWPVVERVPLDLAELGAGLCGVRLLQLSDLHVSRNVPTKYVREQLEYCRTLAPDIVVLTGDYFTAGDMRSANDLTELLRGMSAPLGVYGVLGNHDCGVFSPQRQARGSRLANRVADLLANSGVTVLRNDMRTIRRDGAVLQLVGLEDLWSGACNPEAAFSAVNSDLPCIALAHNPDTIDYLRNKPWQWLLCGHTHGGQVRIPLLGAPILPLENRQFDAGLFEVDGRRLYVNRGLGFLRQIRFNCRPEITLFTLTPRGSNSSTGRSTRAVGSG